MADANEVSFLAAARAGDQDAFQSLTDPYRHELLVHCYRILGSLEDAEDILQETLLRAWRRLDSFEGRASFRAWLYKIATHTSLDALDSRRARSLPNRTHLSADPRDPFPEPTNDPLWLDPLPDTLLHGLVNHPEARYEIRESVNLAFLTALQELPGRQRAVLILRDVLDWSAREVADLLNVTVTAVNSVLQRARMTLEKRQGQLTSSANGSLNNDELATLLARYLQAWETADAARLVALLHEDATLTMPPLPIWYRGRIAIREFFDKRLFINTPEGRFRLVLTQANGCPAFAVYERNEAGAYSPSALQVLSIHNNQIYEIHDFLVSDHRLFSHFGLPLSLDR